MKVVLYMAMTANGLIAKENDDTSFVTKTEWDSYSAAARDAGNLVIGHRTYNILTKQPEFAEFQNVKVVVVAHKSFETLSSNHIVVDSPKAALEELKGFDKVILAGGGILNAAFMEQNLVDEIYLDIEPVVFGRGILLFNANDFEHKLELLGTKKLSDNEIQLHYRVLK